MSYYANYLQRLIGGHLNIGRPQIQPGQLISFRYKQEKTNRRLPRLVLVLGKRNQGGGMLLHGISLENVPHTQLYTFLKRVIIKDTLSQIKRKYEIKGPFSQLIDRPKSFYIRYVKPNLMEYDCYRTYFLYKTTRIKCWMLDWKKLKVFDNTTHDAAVIGKNESLTEINHGKLLLNKVLKADISNLNNARFAKLVNERFGSLSSFYEMLSDIENFTDTHDEIDTDEFNASKY
jgi:hypothetical protein